MPEWAKPEPHQLVRRRSPRWSAAALALLLLVLRFNHYPAQARRSVAHSLVRKVHQSTLLIDTHNDVTSRTVNGFDIGQRSPGSHTDLPRLRAGGVEAVFFAVYVDAAYAPTNNSANRALQIIDTVRHDIVTRYPKDFVSASGTALSVAFTEHARSARSPFCS